MRVLPLHQLPSVSGNDLGSLVYQLKPVIEAKLPIIPGIVIPISTLQVIAAHNQLESKLSGLLATSISENAVADFFTQLLLPQDISQELLTAYHTWLSEWPVTIHPSWTTQSPILQHDANTYQGDAQTIQALLAAWGRTTWVAARKSSMQPWLNAAFVITAHPTATSISIETKSATSRTAAKVTVQGTSPSHGAAEVYEIDTRTFQMVHRAQTTATAQQISDAILIELTKATYRAKQHSIEHLKCTWQHLENHWVITACEALFTASPELNSSSPQTTTSIRGEQCIPGRSTGVTTILAPGTTMPQSWPAPTIIVTDSLHRLDFSQLKNLLGVICERGTSPQVHRLLQQFQIPTVVNVSQALRQLKPLQHITLDATIGEITIKPRTEPTTHTPRQDMTIIAWWPANDHPQLPQSATAPIGGHVLSVEHVSSGLALPGQALRPLIQFPYTWIYLSWSPLRHSSQLQQELTTLKRLNQIAPQHPHLILPPTHHLQEADRFLKQLEKTGSITTDPLWWRITTPENVLHFTAYQRLIKPRGIIIDIDHLVSGLTGIDWTDRAAAALQPFPLEFLSEFLTEIHLTCQTDRLPIFWKISEPSSNLLITGKKLQIAGVMVAPYYVGDTHMSLTQLSTEHQQKVWQ